MAPDFLHITSSWNLIGSNRNPASTKQTTQTCSSEMTWSMLPRKLERSKGLGMYGELWIVKIKVLVPFYFSLFNYIVIELRKRAKNSVEFYQAVFHHCTIRLVLVHFLFFFRIYNITKEFPSKEKGKGKVKAVEG